MKKPRLPDEGRRSERLVVHVRPDEAREIAHLAHPRPIAEFLRKALAYYCQYCRERAKESAEAE